MTTAERARRRRRRQEALVREQQRSRVEARVERLHRFDDAFGKGIAWTAILVFVLVAIIVAAS